ncbi:MAG: acyltransferase family protein [Janthinobacterium lividum]
MPALRNSSAVVYFSGLNVLRCCAALAIVIYHSTFSFKDFLSKAPALVLHNLVVGVDFFLLISGFLITYLLLAEKASVGTISLRHFYLRRALRIFPLYYGIIGLAWVLHHASTPDINFASYLYFGGNFWMVDHSWTVATLNPLWSLCIEEQFYLLVPLLVLLLPTERLPWLFGGIVLISIGFRAYVAIALQSNWMMIYCHTLSRCDVLALGGWLAWQHFRQPIRWALPRWTLPTAVLFLGLLMSIIDGGDYTALNLATFKKYLFLGPLAFIFCFAVFNTPSASAASSIMGRALNYVGKVSYGVYMYHSPIIFLLDQHIPQLVAHPFPRLALVLGCTVLVAALSYELIEKQILRLKTRFA